MQQGGGAVMQGKTAVIQQYPVERRDTVRIEFLCRDGHFPEDVGVAAGRPLAEDHQTAGQDIRPLHGDGDGD